MKTTVFEVRTRSRFPEAIGKCATDLPEITAALNEAVQRLIIDPRQPDTGWMGSWVPMVFNVTRASPFISAPRGISRIMLMDVCKQPIHVQNQFYEFLWAGAGYLPKDGCFGNPNIQGCTIIPNVNTQGILRGYFPIMADVPITDPQTIRAYPTDPLDIGKRILIQGYDQNNMKIYSLSGMQQIEGTFLTLDYPFVDSGFTMTSIYGVQKEVTFGDVPLFAVDVNTGIQTALARYEPSETYPNYPRYYLDSLPQFCCNGTPSIQINALGKRDFYPVVTDTDWLLIGNIPALIAEGQSIFYDGVHELASAQMSLKKHNDAILLLQGELDHYMGKEMPAVNVALFGTAKLRDQGIGTLI